MDSWYFKLSGIQKVVIGQFDLDEQGGKRSRICFCKDNAYDFSLI